jgi:serine/threonine protein kinase
MIILEFFTNQGFLHTIHACRRVAGLAQYGRIPAPARSQRLIGGSIRHQGHGKHMAAQNNAPLPEGLLKLAGYRIVKKIAAGGFSIVYLAHDEEGNPVAIKEYLPSSLALRQVGRTGAADRAGKPAGVPHRPQMLLRGGQGAGPHRHPNVVSVQNFFRAHDTVYMVMAYESWPLAAGPYPAPARTRRKAAGVGALHPHACSAR